MTTLYMAMTPQGATLQTYDSTFYNFGAGDFTIAVMPRPHSAGVLMAYESTSGTKEGFQLSVSGAGALRFTAFVGDEPSVVETVDGALELDGACRCVAVRRKAGSVAIFVDFEPVNLTGGGVSAPLAGAIALSAPAPLVIGGETPGGAGFEGGLMNVGVWTRALDETELQQAGFAVLSPLSQNLAGYWTLDQTSADASPNDNPLGIVGSVTYKACLDCLWVHGDNDFRFVSFQSAPASSQEPGAAGVERASRGVMAESRPVHVPAGAKSLVVGLMSGPDGPITPPAGGHMTLTAPDGTVYDSAMNTESAFVHEVDGVVTAIAIAQPAAGEWRIDVTCEMGQPLYVQAQVIPSDNVAASATDALAPLIDPSDASPRMLARTAAWSGWGVLSVVVTAATVIVAGAVVATATIVTAPAVLVAVAAVGLVSVADAALVSAAMSDDLETCTVQTAGLGGFITAAQRLQLVDANCAGDPATLTIYQQRKAHLYPAVTASSFRDEWSSIIGEDDKQAAVQHALETMGPGYVSMSGHGRPGYIMGWYVSGDDGPMEEVLAARNLTTAEAAQKIFHIFGCWTGYDGEIGLGQTLVNKGAIAFFGYKKAFKLMPKYAKHFCVPDIEIDKALLAGETCEAAYQASHALYTEKIKLLNDNGSVHAAAALKDDRDNLVAPSTDRAYGDASARLAITCHGSAR